MYGLRWAVYAMLAVSCAAQAHEFWIAPQRFEVAAAERIVADLRVGQYFKGNSQVYFPDKFVSFSVTDAGGTRPVEGRLGDLPAASVPTRSNGLHVLAYHSSPSAISYEDFDQFARFARKQGLEWVLDTHLERGLPKRNIKEAYTRYAKSLVMVGSGTGGDRPLGLPLELVAETNPYAPEAGTGVRVRLLWRGEGHADAQLTVFQKRVGCDAVRRLVHTDEDGRATIPTGFGGRFLVNAVHIVEPDTDTLEQINDAVWQTLWASLTYSLPGREGDAELPACDDGDNMPGKA